MGALMRATDWSASPLGPVETWPQSLRTALGILIHSGYPMYIAWGPRFIQFYNDAYRPILGSSKHPRALGGGTADTFAEIWDFIGPMFRDVLEKGTASTYTDQLLPLDRNGYVEECYFTFSYSPIMDEDRGAGGVFVTVLETTERLLRERRLGVLRSLSNISADGVPEICAAAATLLKDDPNDLPFAAIYRLDATGRALLAGSTGGVGDAVAPPILESGEDGLWPLREASRSRAMQIVEFGPRPPSAADFDLPEGVRRAVCAPILAGGLRTLRGFVLAGLRPKLAFGADYQDFIGAIAENVGKAIGEREAYEEERRRAEALAELDRAKTQFFSNVSHEFRTPLTLMLGPIEDEMRAARADGRPGFERLEMAHRNAMRLLKLVNAMLDFSRIEAGRVQASYEPIELGAYTAELASNFRSACEKAGIELAVDCPPLGEPVFVDEDMWEKIVLNLLLQRLQVHPRGSHRDSPSAGGGRRRADGRRQRHRHSGPRAPAAVRPLSSHRGLSRPNA
jgi:signal transduction histidine kinase